MSKLSFMTWPVSVIYSHMTVKMSDLRVQIDSCVNTNTSMRYKEYLTYDHATFLHIQEFNLSVCPSVLLSACIGVAIEDGAT